MISHSDGEKIWGRVVEPGAWRHDGTFAVMAVESSIATRESEVTSVCADRLGSSVRRVPSASIAVKQLKRVSQDD